MQLSRRLLACCSFVRPGDRVADVGCDHGYLSIHLLKENIASAVIAADINRGPLESAVRNAEKHGVTDRVRFFLSDGVAAIPREFDCLILAGMGADTIISILEAAPWLKNNRYRLILQCQSKTAMLRKYLSGQGWWIADELAVRDGRFVYTVMQAQRQLNAPSLTEGQCHFSPALLDHPGEEAAEYYQRLLFSLRRAIRGRGDSADPEMVLALSQLEPLEHQYTWLKEACIWQP